MGLCLCMSPASLVFHTIVTEIDLKDRIEIKLQTHHIRYDLTLDLTTFFGDQFGLEKSD